MRKLISGGLVLGAGVWLYRSQQEQAQAWMRLLLGARPQGLGTAVNAGVERISGVVDAAPLPRTVKDRAVQATTALRSAAGRASGSPGAGADKPTAEQPLDAFVVNPLPEDVLAEQDASARSAGEALREKQAGG